MTAFRWTGRRERAAERIAEDRLTDEQIAAEAGVSRQTLHDWRRHPDFAARVAETVAKTRASVLASGIADKAERIKLYQDITDRLRTVAAERAADPTMADIPGGRTGMLVRGYKSIGSGESARQIEEYSVDGVLARELRDYAKQAAIEMGDWAERRELTGKDGGAIAVDLNLKALSDEELIRYEQLTRKASDPG